MNDAELQSSIETTAAIIDAFGLFIYGFLAMLAAWGIYNTIMLYRSFKKKSLTSEQANNLLKQAADLLPVKGGAENLIRVAQTPPYWQSALGQLVAVAIGNRQKGLGKVKSLLIMEFHTQVVGQIETRLASIATIVRMGPLLGLLGTVASMIAAFGRISGSDVDPKVLSKDISLALWATGSGLLIATPMMVVGNAYHGKLRRLRDETERQLQDFVEILENNDPRSKRGTSRGAILS